jgi:hypothetical protein
VGGGTSIRAVAFRPGRPVPAGGRQWRRPVRTTLVSRGASGSWLHRPRRQRRRRRDHEVRAGHEPRRQRCRHPRDDGLGHADRHCRQSIRRYPERPVLRGGLRRDVGRRHVHRLDQRNGARGARRSAAAQPMPPRSRERLDPQAPASPQSVPTEPTRARRPGSRDDLVYSSTRSGFAASRRSNRRTLTVRTRPRKQGLFACQTGRRGEADARTRTGDPLITSVGPVSPQVARSRAKPHDSERSGPAALAAEDSKRQARGPAKTPNGGRAREESRRRSVAGASTCDG